MAKAKVLNVEGKVRKATIKFAQALLDAGVNVKKVYLDPVFATAREPSNRFDLIVIRGKKRFDVRVYLDYKLNEVSAQVYTLRGAQMFTELKSHNEFHALLTTWNIAKY
jgi:hypothetical protein